MEQLQREADDLGIELDAEQLDQFRRYEELLLTWNARMNLTAIREPEEIRRRHFLDGLTCSLVTGDLNGQRLVDVGSGGGFPGLPLKILYPDLALTLVDSVTKKVRFMRAVVEELALPSVQVVDARAESVGRDPAHRARYDWAVARAVAALPVLLEYLLPLCKVGGRVLAQKGSSAAEEVAAAEKACRILGGGAATLRPVHLPQRPEPHYLVVIPKERPTPADFPRRVGLPARRPL